MRTGFALPQNDPGFAEGSAASAALTETAEAAGYSYLTIADHVLGAESAEGPDNRSPYGAGSPFREVFVHLGHLAALTTLDLVPSIVVLPMRQTALVAKQAAELSLLSEGRLRLGVGIGWNRAEYEALGVDFASRAARFEEQLRVLRLLWTEPVVRYDGAFHTLDGVGIAPLPRRSVPLWIGGGQGDSARGTERVLRRIAVLGDGWISGPALPPDRLGPMAAQLKQYLAEADRDPESVGLQATLRLGEEGLEGKARDAAARDIERLRAAGTTHLTVDCRGADRSVGEHQELLTEMADLLKA